jgi:hypothetical protein
MILQPVGSEIFLLLFKMHSDDEGLVLRAELAYWKALSQKNNPAGMEIVFEIY